MTRTVSVLGLGHIGLPIACTLASGGHLVYAVDINPEIISNLKAGDKAVTDFELNKLLKKVISNQQLEVSIQPRAADVYIIAVPTPLDSNNKPDISYVNNAIESIKPFLKNGDLILIISTCPIGTTHMVANEVRKLYPDIYVACCPERAIPGNIVYEISHNTRIVGGVDQASIEHALNFYKSFVHGEILATDARTAEAVKLAENAYRNLNIAYANELSMLADTADLNIHEIIDLANTHPRVSILKPGIGVGGHCLPIDPLFLVNLAPDLAKLCKDAVEVNRQKTDWVTKKIIDCIKQNNFKIVACLGLTYKPDVLDIRESPALTIVKKLKEVAEVITFDPYMENLYSLDDTIAKADIIVTLVPHKEFFSILPNSFSHKTVLDFASIFS